MRIIQNPPHKVKKYVTDFISVYSITLAFNCSRYAPSYSTLTRPNFLSNKFLIVNERVNVIKKNYTFQHLSRYGMYIFITQCAQHTCNFCYKVHNVQLVNRRAEMFQFFLSCFTDCTLCTLKHSLNIY